MAELLKSKKNWAALLLVLAIEGYRMVTGVSVDTKPCVDEVEVNDGVP